MQKLYRNLESRFDKLTSLVLSILGNSITFVIALITVAYWLSQEEFYKQNLHDCIQDVFSAITFLAFFMIQKWFNHFSAALHLKLNELVSSHDNASNAVINIEHKTEEEIKEIAKEYVEMVQLMQDDTIENDDKKKDYIYMQKLNAFPYHLDFKTTNFRLYPELYRIGIGEQGVLLVEPYKSEILPFWKFKNEEVAQQSAKKIFELFENYLRNNEFVGADMARKFLQMGFTRARRYANHKGGRKYEKGETDHTEGLSYPYSQGSSDKGNPQLPQQIDALTNEKARAATVFKHHWFKAKDHPDYLKMKTDFRDKYYIMSEQ